MQADEVDRTRPEGKWEFNAEVTNAFDDMLARSIPQYELMRQACFDVGCRYVRPSTAILDLGCSRGEALAPFIDKFGAYNRYVGVEVSQPMLEAARQRFAGLINCGVVEIRDLDLRKDYPPVKASVTLSILTLQFTPIEYRQRIVREVYKHTAPGGAFLLVEKILGGSAELDALMVDLYYALKERNGYSRDDIDRKRFALEGVLVPVTARWNEELLHGAGFAHIDCFWRFLNFAGWVAVKE
jgi:tRNA (cmo5U34)-methyltransferase